jgi:hypothetical protein
MKRNSESSSQVKRSFNFVIVSSAWKFSHRIMTYESRNYY